MTDRCALVVGHVLVPGVLLVQRIAGGAYQPRLEALGFAGDGVDKGCRTSSDVTIFVTGDSLGRLTSEQCAALLSGTAQVQLVVGSEDGELRVFVDALCKVRASLRERWLLEIEAWPMESGARSALADVVRLRLAQKRWADDGGPYA